MDIFSVMSDHHIDEFRSESFSSIICSNVCSSFTEQSKSHKQKSVLLQLLLYNISTQHAFSVILTLTWYVSNFLSSCSQRLLIGKRRGSTSLIKPSSDSLWPTLRKSSSTGRCCSISLAISNSSKIKQKISFWKHSVVICLHYWPK